MGLVHVWNIENTQWGHNEHVNKSVAWRVGDTEETETVFTCMLIATSMSPPTLPPHWF